MEKRLPSKKSLLISLGAVAVFSLLTIFYFTRIEPDLPMAKSQSVIETSFGSIVNHSIPVAPRNHQILIATRSQGSVTDLLIGNRQTEMLIYFDQSAVQSPPELQQRWSLSGRDLWKDKNVSNAFLLDVAEQEGVFFVSSVAETLVPGATSMPCAQLAIHKIQAASDAPITQLFWSSDFCLRLSGREYPGWHDLQGRMDFTASHVYMTTGSILSETYEGTYPNRGFQDFPPTLELAEREFPIFGKVLRIELESRAMEIIASGLRGPGGIAVDDKRVGLFITDHGPRGGDELNWLSLPDNSDVGLASSPVDFGWPNVSLGADYQAKGGSFLQKISTEFDSHDGATAPLYAWVPGIAPSQLIVLNEDSGFTNLNFQPGDLIISSLKAESIFHVRLDANKKTVSYVEPILIGSRIRDLELGFGGLVASTDNGQIIFLKTDDLRPSNGAFPPVDALSPIYDSPIVVFFRKLINDLVDILIPS